MASVVFVHGIRTSATMWRAQQRALEAAGVASIAVDLPGHGSRAGEPFSTAQAHQIIDAAVSALDPPHVVVGLSLGSYLAADWAAQVAARGAQSPAALVLASCGTRPRGPALAAYIGVARMIGRFPDGGLGLHTRLARAALPDDAASDLLAGGTSVEAMVPTLQAVARIDLEAALAAITAPVWFANGVLDHFRLEERRLLAATPAATLVQVPRAGHLVALDQPEVFAALVLDVVAQACSHPGA